MNRPSESNDVPAIHIMKFKAMTTIGSMHLKNLNVSVIVEYDECEHMSVIYFAVKSPSSYLS